MTAYQEPAGQTLNGAAEAMAPVGNRSRRGPPSQVAHSWCGTTASLATYAARSALRTRRDLPILTDGSLPSRIISKTRRRAMRSSLAVSSTVRSIVAGIGPPTARQLARYSARDYLYRTMQLDASACRVYRQPRGE